MLRNRARVLSPLSVAGFSASQCLHMHRSKSTLNHPVLASLESCPDMKQLRKIHAKMIISGLIMEIVAASRLIKFCSVSPCGDLHYAFSVFTQVAQPDVFLWNIIIKGCAQSCEPVKAISLYNEMLMQGFRPNEYTFPVLLKASSHFLGADSGMNVHGHVLKTGFDAVVEVQNSLICMYSRCGQVESACKVFDTSAKLDTVSWNSMLDGFANSGDMDSARILFNSTPKRNVISWNVMINGCINNGFFAEALGFFEQMLAQNVKPNEPTLASLISACSHLGALEQGRWIHAYIDRTNFRPNLVLSTALIDMYAKCGSIEAAQAIFDKTRKRDLITWNAMINGHAIHGNARKALALFDEMVESSLTPDGITFAGVLTACSHAGLLDKGREYFDLMTRFYQIPPDPGHFGCLVHVLGRAGRLSEAEELVKTMPVKTDPSVWGALLNACWMHGNKEMGARAGRILMELDPENCGRYTLLSNLFAKSGDWNQAARVRKMMKERGIRKTPGSSLIALNASVHEFVVGDQCHPDIENICTILDGLTAEMADSCDIERMGELDLD
ncbi:pentatricopeptide repeat-containing protein At5g66520-like [Aristolochia californica]|uniref:pentatricopeptide repeat-containing protein At5g66520-like n=1 Tax=Aristolochia californica TaxID=171875 RepID=UPI0035E26A6C